MFKLESVARIALYLVLLVTLGLIDISLINILREDKSEQQEEETTQVCLNIHIKDLIFDIDTPQEQANSESTNNNARMDTGTLIAYN